MKRWQIITYSDDCGADEKLEYSTLGNARCAAREYRRTAQGVIIYDRLTRTIKETRGCFPERSRPLQIVQA